MSVKLKKHPIGKQKVHAYRGRKTACGLTITHNWTHTLDAVTCEKCLKKL